MLKIHENIEQGSDEWYAARCGVLTASEMKLIITPSTLIYAKNDKEKSHLYELAAQRITKYVEPQYISDDMLRGKEDELDASIIYNKTYAPVKNVGFITNNKWGFVLGYSPDGLIGEDGLIEVKGRRQKFQMETISTSAMPEEFKIQVQTGLLVSERKWCDFISYSGGMPMCVLRILPDQKIQDAIVAVAEIFHKKLDNILKEYAAKLADKNMRLIPTERRIEQEITL